MLRDIGGSHEIVNASVLHRHTTFVRMSAQNTEKVEGLGNVLPLEFFFLGQFSSSSYHHHIIILNQGHIHHVDVHAQYRSPHLLWVVCDSLDGHVPRHPGSPERKMLTCMWEHLGM